MKLRLLAVTGAVAMSVAMSMGALPTARPAPAAASAPGYLTLLFAQSAWTLTENCKPVTSGVMTPDRLGAALTKRGLTPTTTVITGWVHDTTRNCIERLPLTPVTKPIQIASWRDLAMMRDSGWKFTSHSIDYATMTNLTAAEQKTEACTSHDALTRRGLPGASGLFNYPNNQSTPTMNADIVLPCGYVLGRKYGSVANTPASVRTSGYLVTHSVNGGACNDTALPCHSLPTPYRYTAPAALAAAMHPAPGTWRVVQMYRLVNGSKHTGKSQWDCMASDWRRHWTAGVDPTELYCWSDYRSALRQIPAGTVTADPRTVEAAWGLAP